jgi:hypothetical protein
MNKWIEILVQNCVQNEDLQKYIDLCINSQSRYNWNRFSSIYKNRKQLKERLGGYYEVHHILPKSFNLGGETDPDNFAYLTPKEHYQAHWLLVNITSGRLQIKMKFAFGKLSQNSKDQERSLTPEEYEVCQQYKSEAVSQFHKGLAKPKTEEHKKKLSESLSRYYQRLSPGQRIGKKADANWVNPLKDKKGKPMPEHVKERLRSANLGKKHSAERRAKHSARMKGHSGLNNKKWRIHDVVNDIEYFPISLRAFIREMGLDDALYEAHRCNCLYKKQYRVYQLTTPDRLDHTDHS